MAELLRGNFVVEKISARSQTRTEELQAKGVTPTLALIRVGENSADGAYERGARKRAEAAGVAIRDFNFPETVTQPELLQAVENINNDSDIHGILLFRPLPKHLDEQAICNAISVEKDVDVATKESLAGVYLSAGGFAPCTAQAVVEMLDAYEIPVAGKRVCVIGRSQVIGKPVAALLLDRNATVTVCHSKSENLPEIVRQADVVVCAVGRAKMFDASYFVPGQTVIDVGINWDEAAGKLVGDVDFAAAEPMVEAISPVPGGVGSVTSAILIEHVTLAAEKLCDNTRD